MTLLDESYEPPPKRSRTYSKVKPAIRTAIENPGRWVQVTECQTKGSAAARASAIRKQLAAGVPGYPGTFEVVADELKVVLRFVPAPAEESDEPHP